MSVTAWEMVWQMYHTSTDRFVVTHIACSPKRNKGTKMYFKKTRANAVSLLGKAVTVSVSEEFYIFS